MPDDAAGRGAALPKIVLGTAEPTKVLWQGIDGSAMLRRRRDDDDLPDPDDGPPRDPQEPPPPTLILPALAVQGDIPDFIWAQIETDLLAGLREQFGEQADIRTLTVGTVRKIAIWPDPDTPRLTEGRANGLRAMELEIPDGSLIALFVNAGFVRQQARTQFAAMPKRLNTDGRPDAGGIVHLTGMEIRFVAPSTVKTIVSGWIDTWPDTSYTMTLTDTLGLTDLPPGIGAETDEHFEADTSLLGFIGIFVGTVATLIASSFAPPLAVGIAGVLGAGYGLGLAAVLELYPITTGLTGGGAGANAARLLPFEIMTGNGQKAVLGYNHVAVQSGGIHAAASVEVQARTPFVRLVGPATVVVRNDEVEHVTIDVRAVTDDLRAARNQPLDVDWVGATAISQRVAGPVITARLRVRITPGEAGAKTVGVRVVDADGLRAEASLRVMLHSLAQDGPPVCRTKPWLPICQPGGDV